MNKIIKAFPSICSKKLRFFMSFKSDVFSDLDDAFDENLKNELRELMAYNNGFSITIYTGNRKLRYIGFPACDGFRVAYFFDGVPYGHYTISKTYYFDEWFHELRLYAIDGHDLYVKVV